MVCQSRPLRANCDASMLYTVTTCPSPTAGTRRYQPGGCVQDPEIPRSSAITAMSCQPSARARSTGHTGAVGFQDCAALDQAWTDGRTHKPAGPDDQR